MSLFGAPALYKVKGEALALADTTAYLSNELGWTLKSIQEQSTIQAISNPDKWLAKRTEDVNAILSTKVKPTFDTAVEEFATLGLPSELIREMAMKRAKNAFVEALEVEELRHPGYRQALGKYEAEREFKENRFTKEDRKLLKQRNMAEYVPKSKKEK